MRARTIGDVRLDAIEELTVPYRGVLEMFPDATEEMVERHRAWLEPECLDPGTDRMIFAFQSYLLRKGDLTILIDCCVGEDKERPLRPDWHRKKWPWLGHLKDAEITPEDVDIVLCTHLHVDHVGWNTRLENGQWVPTFPNARYLFARPEYEYWEKAHKEEPYFRDMFQDSVLPVVAAGQADLVTADHEVASGIWLEPTPGHTPGHVAVNVASQGRSAVFCGDLLHHAIQVPEPQLYSKHCTDPALSCRTRGDFVERHADTDTLIVPAHFPGRTAGRIVERDGALRFDFSDG